MVTNVWLIITGKREDGMMKKIIAFMLAGMLALGSATVDAAQFRMEQVHTVKTILTEDYGIYGRPVSVKLQLK